MGDCAVTRLYKDGIGSAYRTAKAAATTALRHGVGAAAFRHHYQPLCRSIERDNRLGRSLFSFTRQIRSVALGGSPVGLARGIAGAERLGWGSPLELRALGHLHG